MKRISVNTTLLICATITFLSCSKEEKVVVCQLSEAVNRVETRSDIEAPTISDFENNSTKAIIIQDNIPSIIRGFINQRGEDGQIIQTIKTIRKRDLNLAYAVNFKNGGWVIIAGISPRDKSPILAYSESGYFDPDSINNPGEAFWLEMNLIRLEQEMIDYQREEPSVPRSTLYDDPYVWVRFILGQDYSTTNNYSNVNHLIETKWGQNDPWNYKCPILNGTLCPLGCTAVAVGQMLYYLNDYNGSPSGLYHTIIPSYTYHNNNSGSYFTLTVTRTNYYSNSPRWASMATINPGSVTTSVEYVGDLLIDIADRAGSQFTLNSTSGETSTALFSNYYGISCTMSNYSQSTVINSLNDSIPVLVTAKISNSPGAKGHEWIIDGYNSSLTTVDHRYKWRMVPPDSLSYYGSSSYDYVYTESEMQQFYPNVIENEIIHEYSEFITYLLRMNWGWHDNQNIYNDYNDDYDNRLYAMGAWNGGGYDLNYQIKIYHNFQ